MPEHNGERGNGGNLRLGIDVGGTFTHGVLLAPGGAVLQAVKVPTTHTDPRGVSAGVIACLERLLDGADRKRAAAINHSTTQATNALLEGHLEPVEVHVFHREGEGFLARRQLSFHQLKLSRESVIPLTLTLHPASVVPSLPSTEAVPRLIAETIVESEGGVEERVFSAWKTALETANPAAVPLLQKATDISRLLGLKSRVKTGVVNCAMLPTMLATLRHTQDALASIGVRQPLMVLKSDGGVLPAEMVFARPLNCLLSGPAAGAAAALHFAGITFGLFFEVGGTSTDISFIHDGRIRYRPARVGGHRLQAETLDLRTIALGGGSMLGLGARGGVALGPRSAHLAGLGYLSFASDSTLEAGEVELHAPGGSRREYFVWRAADGAHCAFTLTDLANANGLIPVSDAAYAPKEKLQPAFAALERKHGTDLTHLTEAVGAQIERTVAPIVAEYLRSFRLERGLVRLVGGGGGVNSALPFIAARLKLPYEVVEHYPYISALGAAIAAGTVQVKIPSAAGSVDDLQRARGLASAELRQAGMDPARAHYEYSFDATAGVLHLTATAERPWESQGAELAEEALAARAAELTRSKEVRLVFSNPGFSAYEASARAGFRARKRLAVLDRRGKARLIRPDAGWEVAPSAEELLPLLIHLHRDRREFRDAGEVPPQLWIVGEAVHDLSSLPDSASFAEVLAAEVALPGPKFVVITSPAA